MSMRGRAEWLGSLEKSLLSMAAQKPSHSRTKLLLAMPPGMAMSLNRSLRHSSPSWSSNDIAEQVPVTWSNPSPLHILALMSLNRTLRGGPPLRPFMM